MMQRTPPGKSKHKKLLEKLPERQPNLIPLGSKPISPGSPKPGSSVATAWGKTPATSTPQKRKHVGSDDKPKKGRTTSVQTDNESDVESDDMDQGSSSQYLPKNGPINPKPPSERTMRTVYGKVKGKDIRNLSIPDRKKILQNIKDSVAHGIELISTTNNSFRIVLIDTSDVDVLIDNTLPNVEFSRPNSLTKGKPAAAMAVGPKYKKFIIHNVDKEIDDDLVCQEIPDCHRAVRITNHNTGISSNSVILFFSESLKDIPSHITILFERFKLYPHIPKPLRCARCQAYGHSDQNCRAKQIKCPHCGGNHRFDECKTKYEDRRCLHCHGQHSAAYRKCPTFQLQQKTLSIKVKGGLSYRDAPAKARSQEGASAPHLLLPLKYLFTQHNPTP